MKNNFIPLNNDINKLIAFAPSLDKGWRINQRIGSKPFQIETLEAIEGFQNEGWKINGVYQNSNKNRQITSHTVRLSHPDYNIKDAKGNPESIATLTIQNSCNGSKSMKMDLGSYRQVCSNGLIAHTPFSSEVVKHNQTGYFSLPQIISRLNSNGVKVLQEFNKLKNVELDAKKSISLAVQAAEKRFGTDHKIDVSQLLKVARNEDEGNGLWEIYNRIQENLTQPNRLTDDKGKYIPGINDVNEDIRVNKELFELAYAYV